MSGKRMSARAAVPEKMKAVVMSGRGFENVSVREVDVPRPGPDQILARVDAAGVCTSILKILAQGAEHPYLNGWDPAQWPLILGDEGSLTLVEVGENLIRTSPQFLAVYAAELLPNDPECHRIDVEADGIAGYTVGFEERRSPSHERISNCDFS